MSRTFIELGVPADLAAALRAKGIIEPFPIQADAIPPAIAGKDVCGKAPTGSGKTMAFGIPIAAQVGRARPHRPRALILAPTRELAAQIETALRPLLAVRKRSVATFYGGVGFGLQLKTLRKGVDVAVACPGRLADLVNQRVISLEDVDLVVIDEADRMADMGFLPEVRKLLDQVKPDRQTMLFSATLDGDVDVLIRRYQVDPVRCEAVADEEHIDRTTHTFTRVARDERVTATADVVTAHGSAIVFCRTKHGTDRLAQQLGRAGVSAVAIHGGRSQPQRDKALAAFKSGRAQVLVATDVAARGIHVDDVACVVHYDLPADIKDYTHRSGRTGRAGADGVVVALVTEDTTATARMLQRALGQAVPEPARGDRPAAGQGGQRPRRPHTYQGQGQGQGRPQGGRRAQGRAARQRRAS